MLHKEDSYLPKSIFINCEINKNDINILNNQYEIKDDKDNKDIIEVDNMILND